MELNQSVKIKESELLDVPIDYMKLQESDFPEFEEVDKPLVKLSTSGYLLDSNFFEIVKPNEQNTVVVNSSVGQGKSKLAIEIASKYYGQMDKNRMNQYKIIFAVPYKSLVSQYRNNVKEKIKKTYHTNLPIPDYNHLSQINGSALPIHVITINCLLGNPGENSVEQNNEKQKYLNDIIKHCKDNNRKIILIFDEIHDGIKNFEQDLIFNLWKFKTSDALHKVFILSATFTEASKVVIKYIAELTNKKLQIIETERIQRKNPENLSDLYLYFTNSVHYQFNENPPLDNYIKAIIEKHDNFDMLFYSQRQATKILRDDNFRKYLVKKFKRINLCISEENAKYLDRKEYKSILISNEFAPTHCNIGTVFKTGINIEKDNSALIIVLPSDNAVANNELGIFQTVTDITQALARVRYKADIYVIMPKPKKIINITEAINDNLLYTQVISRLDQLRNVPRNDTDSDKYHDYLFKDQSKLLDEKYRELKDKVQNEIDYVDKLERNEHRIELPYLKYPTLDQFILDKGDIYLSRYFAIFGADFPAYMLWASMNNQFVNCKLKTINSSEAKEIKIDTGNIQDTLMYEFEKSYGVTWDCIFSNPCDCDVYINFNKILFLNKIYYKNKRIYSSYPLLQQHILTFIQGWIKGNKKLTLKYHSGIIRDIDNFMHIPDIPFELSDFILCCISNANLYNDETPVENSSVELIQAYKNLGRIREIFCSDRVVKTNQEGKQYIFQSIDNYENELFTQEEKEMFITSSKIIKENHYIKTIFKGFKTIDFDNTTEDEIIKKLYNHFKKIFFKMKDNVERTPIINGQRYNIHYIEEITDLPSKRTGINLLYSYNPTLAEGFEDAFEEILIENYNSYYRMVHEEQEVFFDSDSLK